MPGVAQDNTFSAAEKKAGWRLVFDGKTTTGWRGYKMDRMPSGWKVIDGALVRVSGGAGVERAGRRGDRITVQKYHDIQIQTDWKVFDPACDTGIRLPGSHEASTA